MSKLLRRVSLEVVGSLRRAYAQLESRADKSAFIGNVCLTYGLERKYAIKLLTGNRQYRDAKGRGRTYSEKAFELLKRVWYATGCTCTKYLRATIDKALSDLSELEHVDSALSEEVQRMSASTMDRCLKGLPREGPGSIRKNCRSGANAPAANFTCCSGERIIASSLPPGHVQVDTVALCVGDMHGSFFWILTLTDRKTQWTEIWPVWNRGAEGFARNQGRVGQRNRALQVHRTLVDASKEKARTTERHAPTRYSNGSCRKVAFRTDPQMKESRVRAKTEENRVCLSTPCTAHHHKVFTKRFSVFWVDERILLPIQFPKGVFGLRCPSHMTNCASALFTIRLND